MVHEQERFTTKNTKNMKGKRCEGCPDILWSYPGDDACVGDNGSV